MPDNKFTYEQVEQAMTMMYRMDFGQPVAGDLEAAHREADLFEIAFVKSQPDVLAERIGVTGFCLGGGLTFLVDCKFSEKIAAAASFYGMVLDEWVEAISDIAVPIYLFYGGRDQFILPERIQQIESRFQELGKGYRLKVYPHADHGFFCPERSSYNRQAAEDWWQELTRFFRDNLQKPV